MLKFFVIDDDSVMVDLITVLLEAKGHRVDSRLSAVSGLPWIESQRPDCLIIDLMMAEMDGLELCRQVRAKLELEKTKIIFLSGRTDNVWKKRANDAGAQGGLRYVAGLGRTTEMAVFRHRAQILELFQRGLSTHTSTSDSNKLRQSINSIDFSDIFFWMEKLCWTTFNMQGAFPVLFK